MKKASEKAALILVCLAAVVVIALVAASTVSERRRLTALEQVRKPASMETYARYSGTSSPSPAETEARADHAGAEGVPRSKPPRPKSPDQTIAEYRRLFDDYVRRNGEDPDFCDIGLWRGPFDELSPEDKIRFAKALEANQDFLGDIRQIAQAGGPVFPLDFSKGYMMELPHLARVREFARLLCRDAVLQARNGNLELAVEDLIAGMQLGDALVGEPVLICQLVRIAVYDSVSDGITDGLPPAALSSDQTMALVAPLAQADNRQAFADSLSGEGVMGLAEFEQMRGAPPPEWLEMREGNFDRAEEALFRLYTSPLARPWFNNDEATYAELMGQMAEVAELPYYEAEPVLSQLGEEIDSLPATRVLSSALLPGLARSQQAQARHEANVDLMQMGLLLEQYYVNHGEYPESLEAIGSSLGGTLPVDPFSGESYVYQPSANSFSLYGVGRNQTDDGGVHDVREGDMVWRGREAN